MIFDTSGNHCMIDLETLDTVPGGVILSIGAVMFNTDEVLHGSEFYTVIHTGSCTDVNLLVNQDTVDWWNSQPEEAQKEVLKARFASSSNPLLYALGKFSQYLEQFDPVGIWGNGSDFDNAFLAVAYRKAGLTPPWSHKKNRCFRTLKALVGDSAVKPDTQGTHHNALYDARYQAIYAVSMFKALDLINQKVSSHEVR